MHLYIQTVIIKLYILSVILPPPLPSPIPSLTHPPYQRLIWDYKKADSEKIRKTLDSVNWERIFNKKDIDTQVAVFDETILNVFRNYVPNMYITIDDKDPVWMNETIKLKIKAKNNM